MLRVHAYVCVLACAHVCEMEASYKGAKASYGRGAWERILTQATPRLVDKRLLECHHVINRAPQGPDVRAAVVGLTLDKLWAHVDWRAHFSLRLHVRRGERLAQPKITCQRWRLEEVRARWR